MRLLVAQAGTTIVVPLEGGDGAGWVVATAVEVADADEAAAAASE